MVKDFDVLCELIEDNLEPSELVDILEIDICRLIDLLVNDIYANQDKFYYLDSRHYKGL